MKELIDNSIDAGADKIDVTFAEYASKYLEVSDNGCGIDPSDYEALCLKYHTSKLSSYEDLSTVSTLGFRGEAMSSLCSVATVSVNSSSASTFPKSVQLQYDNRGKLTGKKSHVSGKKGTTVTMSDLFFNLPVRYKNFIKHCKREYTKALSLIFAYLLAYTKIRFTVFSIPKSGKRQMVLGTSGGLVKLSDVMVNLYGSNGAYGLVPLNISVDNLESKFRLKLDYSPSSMCIKLQGSISDCSFGMGRSATDRQFLSINNRPVIHKRIAKIINEVYRSFNTTQSPTFVLDLTLDPHFLDVNITPDKRSVVIHAEDLVLDVIREELTLFYEGRNNAVPKSRVGTLHIGSSQSSRPGISIPCDPPIPSDLVKVTRTVNSNQLNRNSSHVEEMVQRNDLFVDSEEEQECGKENDFTEVVSEENTSAKTTMHNSRDVEVLHSKTLQSSLTLASGNSMEVQEGREEDEEDDDHENDQEDYGYYKEVEQVKKTGECHLNTDRNSIANSFQITSDNNVTGEAIFEDTILLENEGSNNSIEDIIISCPEEDEDLKDIDGENSRGDSDRISQNSQYSQKLEMVSNNSPKKKLKAKEENSLHTLRSEFLLSEKDLNGTFIKPIEPTSKDMASLHDISQIMEIKKLDFLKMEIVGQFNSGFIIVTHENRLFIVDQHALDEIYNYERLMKTLVLRAQPLVVPRILELSPIDEMKMLDFSSQLRKNGFQLEEIEGAPPGRKVRLVAVPISKNVIFDDSDLHELVNKFHEHCSLGSDAIGAIRCSKAERTIALRACRLSIMIGLALLVNTMALVVLHLSTLDRPWNCPHGRPTFRHLADLEGHGFVEDYSFI